MSSFICEHCGQNIIDTPQGGYITACIHHPFEELNKDLTSTEEALAKLYGSMPFVPEKVLEDCYLEWESLLIEAIGKKVYYTKEDILRAMYLSASEREWEVHPENPLNIL